MATTQTESFAEDGQIVQPQSPDDERVVGDGQAYRGKQAKSKSGAECKGEVGTNHHHSGQ